MKKFRTVSIIIPVYNEAGTIATIIKRVLAADTLGMTKEVIVVNDGSTDKTVKILNRVQAPSVRVYHQPYNKGKGAALRHGFEMATGDIILVQDGDLEYNPKDYPRLLAPILAGETSVVYGSRMLGQEKMRHGGWLFYIGGQGINWLTNALYAVNLSDEATGYKVFTAPTLRSIHLVCNRFEFCPEITAKLAKRNIPIYEVPISYTGRKVAEGKKINWRDGLHAIWTLFKYKLVR